MDISAGISTSKPPTSIASDIGLWDSVAAQATRKASPSILDIVLNSTIR